MRATFSPSYFMMSTGLSKTARLVNCGSTPPFKVPLSLPAALTLRTHSAVLYCSNQA